MVTAEKRREYNLRYAEKHPERIGKWNREHPERKREISRRYARKHLDNIWANSLNLKFKMTKAQYDEMLVLQGGRCKICSCTIEENGRRLSVDHSHTTGKVRGLLCIVCNAALGIVERKEFVERAQQYLRMYEEKNYGND
jgi:hypothetical protein